MSQRAISLLLAAAVAIYAGFALWRGWFLLLTGDPALIVFGIAIAVLPVLGAWMLYRELKFGWQMQAMGRQLAAEGGLLRDDLPKTPSGRAQLDAADERFAELSAAAEAEPDNWRVWFRLALGYDESRDRKRARRTMRKAVDIYLSNEDSGPQA
jgi:hypothetical protein